MKNLYKVIHTNVRFQAVQYTGTEQSNKELIQFLRCSGVDMKNPGKPFVEGCSIYITHLNGYNTSGQPAIPEKISPTDYMAKLIENGKEVFHIKAKEEFESLTKNYIIMHKNLSLHFTIKNQDLGLIEKALNQFIQDNIKSGEIKLSGDGNPGETFFHHCFLPAEKIKELGFPFDLHKMMSGQLGLNQIQWYGSSNKATTKVVDAERSRQLMLQNLLQLDGMAVFIGEIKEGVKEEYDLAIEMGIPCYCVAL